MNNILNKSILVTGASSGIGYAVAVYLAKHGCTVLATVRKNADSNKLNALGLINLNPLCPFDLTKPEQIEAIADSVIEKIKIGKLPALYAIINIAGGGQISPIELMEIDKQSQKK